MFRHCFFSNRIDIFLPRRPRSPLLSFSTAPHPHSPTESILFIMPPAKKKQKHSSHAARISRSLKNSRVRLNKTKKKNQSNSPPLVQVLHPEMYVETNVLPSNKYSRSSAPTNGRDTYFDTVCPATAKSPATNQFTVHTRCRPSSIMEHPS